MRDPRSSADRTRPDALVRRELFDQLIVHPKLAAQCLGGDSTEAGMSGEMLREFLHGGTEGDTSVWGRSSMQERILALARIAEDVNRSGRERDYFNAPGDSIARYLRASHAAAKNISDTYELRREHLRSEQNYLPARILEVLFEKMDGSAMARHGVRVMRGHFKEGTQFIGFWDETTFHRIYVDPAIHLSERARALLIDADRGVDALNRNEFELFNGLLMPHRSFDQVARTVVRSCEWIAKLDVSDEERVGFLTNTRALVTIAETEFSVREFTQLYNAVRAVRKDIRAGRQPDQALIENLLGVVGGLTASYAARFVGRSARDVLNERVGTIEEREHVLGPEFLEKIERELGSRDKCDSRVANLDSTTRIFRVSEKGLSFAQEEEIIRKMRLKRAPVVSVFGGAKELPAAGEMKSQAERMVEIVDQVTMQCGAHVLVPETAVGMGALFGIANHARRHGKSADEIAASSQIFGIGPGKGLYYDGNTDAVAAGKDAWAASAMNIIATDYLPGWATHGTQSEQRRHNYYRQAFTRRLASEPTGDRGVWKEHPRVAVVGNGGGWTVLETLAALEDDTEVLFVKDTGRFALLMSTIIERRDEWFDSRFDDEALKSYVLPLIESIHPESERDIIRRDVDRGTYWSDLIEILQIGRLDLMKVTDIERLKVDLSASLRI